MHIPLIVVGVALLLLLLLLTLRVKLYITYREEIRVSAGALGIKIRLYPRKKKIKWRKYSPERAAKIAAKEERKRAKDAAKKAKKQAQKKAKTEPQEVDVAERMRMVRALVAALFRRAKKHLHLHTARLRIRVASSDAAKTAILYGAVCQSLSYLLAILDRMTKLKSTSSEVEVFPDYLSEKSTADVKLVFSISVYGILALSCAVVIAAMKKYPDPKKQTDKNIKKKAAKQAARTAGTQKGHRHG